jgi:hypothetical protein
VSSSWLRPEIKVPNPYPYPETVSRDPADVHAALGAFRRLYEYALRNEDAALAVFAAYKALQKVDRKTNEERIQIPKWVADGLWRALETYIMNMKHPSTGPKHQKTSFKVALRRLLRKYQRWYAMHEKVGSGEAIETAAHNLASKGRGQKILEQDYRTIRKLWEVANSLQLAYEDGQPLPPISPRDLVPTQRLLQILGNLNDPVKQN